MRRIELPFGGEIRSAWVYRPGCAPPSHGFPLLLALHGGGINGERMAEFCGLSEMAEKAGFVVVYPDGTGRVDHARSWNAGLCCGHARKYGADDLGFLRVLVNRLRDELPLDPPRTYSAGVSNGGMMSYRLAAELPDLFAAICSVAGHMMIETPPAESPVSVLHFHGTADEFTPHLGGRGPRSPSQTQFPPLEETIRHWVRACHCDPEPRRVRWVDSSGLEIRRDEYREAGLPQDQTPREVIYYEIAGGGHTWPGRKPTLDFLGRSTSGLVANEVLWEFCMRHRVTWSSGTDISR